MPPLGSHAAPGLRLHERLGLRLIQPIAVLGALVRSSLLYCSYRGTWPWKRLFVVSVLRVRRLLSVKQRQAASPQTGAVIADYAARTGIQHSRIPITVEGYPDIWLHELDFGADANADDPEDEKADKGGKVLFYAHGGGFAHTIVPPHLQLVKTLIQSLGGRKVYLPEYSLSPAHPFPAPVVQVITALAHVLSLNGVGISPHRLVVAGDSAGGNLIAAALAHAIRPSPHCRKITFDTLSAEGSPRPLAAAILIAPYVTYHQVGNSLPPSVSSNASIDYLTRTADLNFQRLYAPPSNDIYAEPGIAPADFWASLGDVVTKVQVTAGAWELIRDDILAFGAKLQQSTADVVVQIADHAVHVEPCVDFGYGSDAGDQLRLLKAFCSSI